MRLIDADALEEQLDLLLIPNHKILGEITATVRTFTSALVAGMPTVEAVAHGNWKQVGANKRGYGGVFLCSVCDNTYPYKTSYCPNCGAKMDA